MAKLEIVCTVNIFIQGLTDANVIPLLVGVYEVVTGSNVFTAEAKKIPVSYVSQLYLLFIFRMRQRKEY